jgi:hypothetical protein
MRIFEFAISLLLRLLPCAFDPAGMNRIHGGTVGLWLYKISDTDTITQVIVSDYFGAYVDELRQGDVIIVVDPGTSVDVCTVTSADNASPVTIANGT